MKKKVALIATLMVLALCVGFLWASSYRTSQVLNHSALEEIAAICRLSAEKLDGAAFAKMEDLSFLRQVATDSGMTFSLYNSYGETLFTNEPQIEGQLTPEQIEKLLNDTDEVVTFESPQAISGTKYLNAVKKIPEGYFLCISREAYRAWNCLGSLGIVLFILAIVVTFTVYGMLRMADYRTTTYINDILQGLRDFVDGDFERRFTVSGSGESIEQSARFNEVLSSLQDRVFKQNARNQALARILNSMENGVIAVDNNLNLMLATPSACKMLDIKDYYESVPLELACKTVRLENSFREAMEKKDIQRTEVMLQDPETKEPRPINLYITPMLKDENVTGAVALVEDVTKLRKLEQIRTDFAASVSHELRTPLTSIKGFVETLQQGAVDNPEMARKFLNIIMMEAERLTRLINDILTVTKMESGKEAPPEERIRLDYMAEDVIEQLKIVASKKHVTITCRHQKQHSEILGNRDRVEQLLINLIDNAIKYNKEGGSVTVHIENTDKNVNLLISDTGIGIPPESIPHLWERFYRVDKGRSRAIGGTGLGLSIVKHIVNSMNGMIEVHSRVGEGSMFLITFPRLAPQEEKEEIKFNDPFDDPDFDDGFTVDEDPGEILDSDSSSPTDAPASPTVSVTENGTEATPGTASVPETEATPATASVSATEAVSGEGSMTGTGEEDTSDAPMDAASTVTSTATTSDSAASVIRPKPVE